jgi:hypothetical protein
VVDIHDGVLFSVKEESHVMYRKIDGAGNHQVK